MKGFASAVTIADRYTGQSPTCDAMYQAKKCGRNQVVVIAEAGAGSEPTTNMAVCRDS